MQGDSGELTDEGAVREWFGIAEATEQMIHRAQDKNDFVVEAGSELAEDDVLSDPYQVSHCGRHFINAGTDHLHAVNTLIIGVKPVIHASADYTLLRASLEHFGVAFWVLNPSDRRARIERALQCAAQTFKDQDMPTTDIGDQGWKPLNVKLADVKEVAGRAGCRARRSP
jgi:hypothetical protein